MNGLLPLRLLTALLTGECFTRRLGASLGGCTPAFMHLLCPAAELEGAATAAGSSPSPSGAAAASIRALRYVQAIMAHAFGRPGEGRTRAPRRPGARHALRAPLTLPAPVRCRWRRWQRFWLQRAHVRSRPLPPAALRRRRRGRRTPPPSPTHAVAAGAPGGPGSQGWRMAAEWEPQQQTWLGWPWRPDVWRDNATCAGQLGLPPAHPLRLCSGARCHSLPTHASHRHPDLQARPGGPGASGASHRRI